MAAIEATSVRACSETTRFIATPVQADDALSSPRAGDCGALVEAKRGPEPANSAGTQLGWFAFFLMGLASLLPWFSLLTALDFFIVAYPQQSGIDLWFTCLYCIPLVLISTWQIQFGTKVGFAWRFYAGFGTHFFTLIVLVLLTLIPDVSVGWDLTVVVVLVLGCANALIEGGLYSFAFIFSPAYVQAVQIGQGYSGIVLSVLRIVTKAAFYEDARGIYHSAYLFFSLTCAVCASACFVFMKFMGSAELASRSEEMQRDHETIFDYSTVRQVLFHFWPCHLAIFLSFFITLTIFPGVAVEIQSAWGLDQGWFIVLMVFVFNIFDTAGRNLTCPFIAITNQRGLLGYALCRLVFLPLFVACARTDPDDLLTYLLLALLAATHGHLSVNAMTFMSSVQCPPGDSTGDDGATPDCETQAVQAGDQHFKEVSGTLGCWVLVLGLSAGVFFAIPMSALGRA